MKSNEFMIIIIPIILAIWKSEIADYLFYTFRLAFMIIFGIHILYCLLSRKKNVYG